MSDQNQDPDKIDDLDSFEDDFDMDFDESDFDDLPEDDLGGGELSAASHDSDLDYLDDDFMDDNWDDEFDESFQDGLIQKEKSNLDFNKIVIAIAVVVGLCVLAYQVVSQRPDTVERFRTALNMTGSTEGPVFDSNLNEEDGADTSAPDTLEISDGFLKDPLSLDPADQMAQTQADQPPMPVPLTQEDQNAEGGLLSGSDIMTPLPEIDGTAQAFDDNVQTADFEENAVTPRGPDDTLDMAAPRENDAEPNEAEKLLQAAMQERTGSQNAFDETVTDTGTSMEEPSLDTDSDFGFGMPANDPAEPDTPENEQAEEITQPLEQEPMEDPAQNIEDMGTDFETVSPAEMEMTEDAPETVVEETVADTQTDMMPDTAQEDITRTASLVQRTLPTPRPQQAAVSSNDNAEKAPGTSIRRQAVQRTRWILRSAQPGKAWVSRPGQKDMTSLIVGDTLSGIGEITSIEFRNGRWTVQGTRGRINQSN